ncbi:MAG: acyclic terpene utilization AtuA family protein [Pirellulales bacterium]
MPLRIANAAGFLGDNLDAPRLTVERAEVDYLTLEYLAELTMSILARQREKNPRLGYAEDFLTVLVSLVPALTRQPRLRIVTNAGGVNPLACAHAAGAVLVSSGLSSRRIGVVTGDDLLPRLFELRDAGCRFVHLDTGEPLADLAQPIVCANAYLGARPIADALAAGAELVITGRVADASLAVGPAADHFDWTWDDWNTVAGASVAGHLIECGAQVSGGLHHDWQALNLADVGYPIAELERDGSCVITKPADSGGAVNRRTVAEQLVYEIGDPAHYLTPDVDVDFTTIELAETGDNRVAVRGATGRPPPDQYKVSLAYHDGYMASGQLLIYGNDCVSKAHACGEMIRRRLARTGLEFAGWHVECLGAGQAVPGLHAAPDGVREVMLRVTARDSRREPLERFTKEFAPLITSGPPGIAGYATGRPQVRPVFAYWPTLVPREVIDTQVEVRTAREWMAEKESP